MANTIVGDRGVINKIIASGDKRRIRFMMRSLEYRLHQARRYYPIPSLIESFEQDMARLKAALLHE